MMNEVQGCGRRVGCRWVLALDRLPAAETQAGGDVRAGRPSTWSATRSPRRPTRRDQRHFAETPTPARASTFKASYGASGDQSRAVEAGQTADVVHFSLEPDVTRLVDAGLVAEDWKDNATKGIVDRLGRASSWSARATPKDIQGWDDLVKPGVEIVTPNPGSSGGARWNILAAYGNVIANGGTRGRRRGVPDQVLREHRRAARQRPRRDHRVHRAATATCCSPTRTRRSWPARTARTSTTSSPTRRC